MPPPSKTGRRRYGKKYTKPSMKKAKQMVTKQHKTKAKKNMDTFFLRAKVNTTITPSQGAVVANYIYQHFSLMDQTGPLSVTNIPEFNLYRIQYDKVRINSVHVVVTPKANTFDAAIAQNDDLNVSGSGVIHTAIDRDGPAPSNVAAIERYPSYKKYDIKKKFSRMYSIRWGTNEWLDCQNIYATAPEDTLRRWGAFGGVTIYAENLPEDLFELINEPTHHVEVYYNCVFQGKTSASLSVGDDGSVTLTPHENFAPLPFSALGTGTQGGPTGRVVTYDNSGNEVIMRDRQDHS